MTGYYICAVFMQQLTNLHKGNFLRIRIAVRALVTISFQNCSKHLTITLLHCYWYQYYYCREITAKLPTTSLKYMYHYINLKTNSD